jgi:TctA family transporter
MFSSKPEKLASISIVIRTHIQTMQFQRTHKLSKRAHQAMFALFAVFSLAWFSQVIVKHHFATNPLVSETEIGPEAENRLDDSIILDSSPLATVLAAITALLVFILVSISTAWPSHALNVHLPLFIRNRRIII